MRGVPASAGMNASRVLAGKKIVVAAALAMPSNSNRCITPGALARSVSFPLSAHPPALIYCPRARRIHATRGPPQHCQPPASSPAGRMTTFAKGLGPIFVGVVLSVALYGVTLAQILFYLWHYHDDGLALKCFVFFLCLLDTAGTMLNVEFLWYYFIESRVHPSGTSVVPPPYAAEHALESLAVFLVQCFYIHNVWSLTGAIATATKIRRYRVPFSIAATLFALISLAGGIGIVVETTSTTGAYKLVKELTVPGVIQPLAAVMADAYITGSLCWILDGSRTGLRGTESLVGTLTTYAVNRGVLTSIFQLLQFATYVSDIAEGTFIVDIFSIPGSTREWPSPSSYCPARLSAHRPAQQSTSTPS
ncbi:hypothetical protein DAEQUDRAFT_598478 [Daedalea quercina L-15889]|uniref:DUF6534 domain-containing protein n=1 Tax=Daedalea quercina L-15889 TaxID=1314783 RepID=A0A165LPF9_9APHY|nr:hypothetical protein DAEQUDRAFT_598478 [Daedalea quercina L-15889]